MVCLFKDKLLKHQVTYGRPVDRNICITNALQDAQYIYKTHQKAKRHTNTFRLINNITHMSS